MDILIVIIATYLCLNYIFPAFDLIFQYIQCFVSDKVGIIQVRMEERVKEFELKYPDSKEELSSAIGFHMEQSENEFEKDEEYEGIMTGKANEVVKNKMGFHK